jgi:hypothetical protein
MAMIRVNKIAKKEREGEIGFCSYFKFSCFLAVIFIIASLSGSYAYEVQMEEAIIFKPDLVWQVEGEKGYSISLLKEGTHELNSAVSTEGKIESITANWDFEGEAVLEVSADNGANYTELVNGVPLTDGFVPGNQLKWRAKVEKDSNLSKVRINYTDSSGRINNFGTPELSGFFYKKYAYIDNPTDQDLFNYQIKIVAGETSGDDGSLSLSTQADFKDVRFTAADGQTILPHYLESVSGVSGQREAVFWVKVPQIPAGGVNLYLYYGNPEAEDRSSPEDVFYLYDDFRGDQLNQDKWDITLYAGGSYEHSSSLLKLDAAKVIAKDYTVKDAVIEWQAKIEPGSELRVTARGDQDNAGQSQIAYSSDSAGIEHSLVMGNTVGANTVSSLEADIFYQYRLEADGDDLNFLRYSSSEPNFLTKQTEVTYKDSGGLKEGYLALATSGNGNGDRVAYFDWIRVRALAPEEPYLEDAGPEEKTNLAQFRQTTVSSDDGVLTSKPDAVNPEYLSPVISLGDNISALKAEIQTTGEDIRIDISTNGGLTWQRGLLNQQIYRAPDGFSQGSKFMLQLSLPEISSLEAEYGVEEIKVVYSQGPVVSADNIYYRGASGADGTYIQGDTIYVEWDNSPTGDNNSGIISVSCNLAAFNGPEALKMKDKDGDGIWSAEYKLADGVEKTANAFVKVSDENGYTIQDGHILQVDTNPDQALTDEAAIGDIPEEEDEAEAEKEAEEDEKEVEGKELYELAVMAKERTSSEPGSYQKGDVIAIMPAGHSWTNNERASFVIIKAYLDESQKQKLLSPQLEIEPQTQEAELERTGKPKVRGRRQYRINLDKQGDAQQLQDRAVEAVDE